MSSDKDYGRKLDPPPKPKPPPKWRRHRISKKQQRLLGPELLLLLAETSPFRVVIKPFVTTEGQKLIGVSVYHRGSTHSSYFTLKGARRAAKLKVSYEHWSAALGKEIEKQINLQMEDVREKAREKAIEFMGKRKLVW